jgi:glutaminyl-tRNA synthetase
VVKDEDGEITEIHCTYDPETHGGSAPDGRKVKATLHWVSAEHALEAEVRQYEHLFDKYDASVEEEGKTFLDYLNPKSLQVLYPCYAEPGLADAQPGDRYQFERIGYYVVDPDSTPKRLVFNQTVSLRDQWKKVQQRG